VDRKENDSGVSDANSPEKALLRESGSPLSNELIKSQEAKMEFNTANQLDGNAMK